MLSLLASTIAGALSSRVPRGDTPSLAGPPQRRSFAACAPPAPAEDGPRYPS